MPLFRRRSRYSSFSDDPCPVNNLLGPVICVSRILELGWWLGYELVGGKIFGGSGRPDVSGLMPCPPE